MASVRAQDGPVRVLVNNAGFDVCTPIEHQSAEQAQRVVATNLLGPMYLVGQVYPQMLADNLAFLKGINDRNAIRFGFAPALGAIAYGAQVNITAKGLR